MPSSPLQDARRSIDKIDRRVVELLAERFALVDELSATKAASGAAVRDPEREQELLDRVSALAEEHGLSPDLVRPIYEEVLARSVRRQRRRRGEASAAQKTA